jgi:hypothetical protein
VYAKLGVSCRASAAALLALQAAGSVAAPVVSSLEGHV